MHAITPTRSTSPLAIVSLVAGVLGWTLAPVLGSLVAIVTGHVARGDVRRGNGAIDCDGLAIGGLVLGYLALALAVIGVVVVILFFGGLAALMFWAN